MRRSHKSSPRCMANHGGALMDPNLLYCFLPFLYMLSVVVYSVFHCCFPYLPSVCAIVLIPSLEKNMRTFCLARPALTDRPYERVLLVGRAPILVTCPLWTSWVRHIHN